MEIVIDMDQDNVSIAWTLVIKFTVEDQTASFFPSLVEDVNGVMVFQFTDDFDKCRKWFKSDENMSENMEKARRLLIKIFPFATVEGIKLKITTVTKTSVEILREEEDVR